MGGREPRIYITGLGKVETEAELEPKFRYFSTRVVYVVPSLFTKYP